MTEKQKNEQVKNVLITHNDLDGLGGKCLALWGFGEDVVVYSVSNEMVDETIRAVLSKEKYQNATLWITDVTPSTVEVAELLESAYKTSKKIVLLDHHASAFHLNKYEWATVQSVYENGSLTCGTSLFYEYLVRESVVEKNAFWDSFVELVRLYDTWEWKEKNELFPKQTNDLLYLVGNKTFVESVLAKSQVDVNVPYRLDEKENILLEVEQQKINQYIKRKSKHVVRMEWEGYVFGVVHAESYASELGNDLSEKFNFLDAIAIINMGNKKVSLRTIHDDVDVSEIAVRYNGGGHPKASGFSINEEVYELFVHKTYFLEEFKEESVNKFNQRNGNNSVYFEDAEGDAYHIRNLSGQYMLMDKYSKPLGVYGTFLEAERALHRSQSVRLMDDERYVSIKAAEFNLTHDQFKSQFHKI